MRTNGSMVGSYSISLSLSVSHAQHVMTSFPPLTCAMTQSIASFYMLVSIFPLTFIFAIIATVKERAIGRVNSPYAALGTYACYTLLDVDGK
jgi:hypothetical protein